MAIYQRHRPNRLPAVFFIFLIALFCLTTFPMTNMQKVSAEENWTLLNPLGLRGLNGIWGSSDNSVYAVGNAGIIMHYDGTKWNTLPSATTEDLYGIWGTSATDIFVVGSKGVILHFDGATWIQMTSGTTQDFCAAWGSSPNNVYAVAGSQYIFHYDGNSWSNTPSGTTSALKGIWGSSANDIFAVGSYSSGPDYIGTILHFDGNNWTLVSSQFNMLLWGIWGSSKDGIFVSNSGPMLHYDGVNWNQMAGADRMLRVWGTSDDNVFAVGYGQIRRYNGTSWEGMSAPTASTLTSVWGSSTTNVFAVGVDGAIFHYDGTNHGGYPSNMFWTAMDGGTAASLWGIWGTSANDVFAVGDDGAILHYDGKIWHTFRCGYGIYGRNIWGSSSSDVYAVGHGSNIYHYDGSRWIDTGVGTHSYGIWGSSSTDVFAVGGGGRVLHFNGTNWTTTISDPQHIHYGVWGTSNNDVFIVGDAGVILHFNGSNWSPMTSGTTNTLYGIWGSSPIDVYAVGVSSAGGGAILHYDGNIWSMVYSDMTDALYAVWGRSSSDVYAVGSHRTVRHYDGNSWNSMNPDIAQGLGLCGVWGTSTAVFVAGYSGTILRYGTVPVATPPTVVTDNASDVTTTSVVLNGNLTSLGTASSCNVTFQWGTSSGSYPSETSIQTKNSTGTFSANLSSLSPSTPYYFRAKAVGDGTSYGDELSFTTGMSAPVVTTGNASNVSANSAKLHGNLSSLGTSSSCNVSFQYDVVSNNYTAETPATMLTAPGDFEYKVKDLEHGTTYYYRAKAVGDGTGYGEEKTFTTSGKPSSITTSTNTGTLTLQSNLGNFTSLSVISVQTLPNLPPLVVFPHGLFYFEVSNIEPGATVTFTIIFPVALPGNVQYWKYQPAHGWFQIPITSHNGNVITIQIQDGGLGDADGLANGIIVDPGGPAVPTGGGTDEGAAEGASTGESSATRVSSPQMQIAYLKVNPSQAKANQPITITANVVNEGGMTGSTNVALKINGQIEQTKLVSVGPGGSRPLKFTVIKAEPGSYTVIMGSQRASFVVVEDSAKSASPIEGSAIPLMLLSALVVVAIGVLVLAFRRPTY